MMTECKECFTMSDGTVTLCYICLKKKCAGFEERIAELAEELDSECRVSQMLLAEVKRLKRALEKAKHFHKKTIAECRQEEPDEVVKWLKAFAEEMTTEADSFPLWLIEQALMA